MILLLDNYDSFVHNIARYLRLGGKATRVIRSDAITAEQCWRLQPEAIILSPGPHGPESAGCCMDVITQLAGEIPLLGICLGHQAIAAAYGGTIRITPPCHAIASRIRHDGTSVFAGMPDVMNVGRYHSLCVDEATLPPALQVTAWTTDEISDSVEGVSLTAAMGPAAMGPAAMSPVSMGTVGQETVVMGIADHARCVHGVQFHPESLLTEHGQALLGNFFTMVDRHHARRRSITGTVPASGRPVAWMSHSRFSPESVTDLSRLNDSPSRVPPISIATPKQRSTKQDAWS